MKLLFDENLSPRLIETLASEFPDSAHPETLGMRGKTDADFWNYARDFGFVIVSKDNDFASEHFCMAHHRKSFGFRLVMQTQ